MDSSYIAHFLARHYINSNFGCVDRILRNSQSSYLDIWRCLVCQYLYQVSHHQIWNRK